MAGKTVKNMTKYAEMVTRPEMIKYHLQKALFLAMHDRPGPVWIDIPLNVQRSVVDTDDLLEYYPDEETGDEASDPNAAPAYDPDAAPGEDPYAMPDSPVEEYKEPECPDEGDDPARGGSADGGSADSTSSGSANTGSDEVVDFEIDMKEKE